MCTVTYLPTSHLTYILTSSRDERIGRKPASFPATRLSSYHKILFPQDGDKGGTWIACSDALTVCLLNGAFENHISKPPYHLSRGLVVLAVFEYASADLFLQEYDLTGVEPFTMIIMCQSENLFLTELRWDGQQKHTTVKDARQPHIWSSVTLYTLEMSQEREKWFDQWLQQQAGFSVAAVRDFHHNGGQADQTYSIRMNRPGLAATVSITTVVADKGQIMMLYEDVVRKEMVRAGINRIEYLQAYE